MADEVLKISELVKYAQDTLDESLKTAVPSETDRKDRVGKAGKELEKALKENLKGYEDIGLGKGKSDESNPANDFVFDLIKQIDKQTKDKDKKFDGKMTLSEIFPENFSIETPDGKTITLEDIGGADKLDQFGGIPINIAIKAQSTRAAVESFEEKLEEVEPIINKLGDKENLEKVGIEMVKDGVVSVIDNTLETIRSGAKKGEAALNKYKKEYEPLSKKVNDKMVEEATAISEQIKVAIAEEARLAEKQKDHEYNKDKFPDQVSEEERDALTAQYSKINADIKSAKDKYKNDKEKLESFTTVLWKKIDAVKDKTFEKDWKTVGEQVKKDKRFDDADVVGKMFDKTNLKEKTGIDPKNAGSDSKSGSFLGENLGAKALAAVGAIGATWVAATGKDEAPTAEKPNGESKWSFARVTATIIGAASAAIGIAALVGANKGVSGGIMNQAKGAFGR